MNIILLTIEMKCVYNVVWRCKLCARSGYRHQNNIMYNVSWACVLGTCTL